MKNVKRKCPRCRKELAEWGNSFRKKGLPEPKPNEYYKCEYCWSKSESRTFDFAFIGKKVYTYHNGRWEKWKSDLQIERMKPEKVSFT